MSAARMTRIVKSGDLPPAANPLHLGDLEEQAARILAEARARADRLLADAAAEAERLRAAAREQGRAAGVAEGRAQGLEAGRKEAAAAAGREFAERTAAAAQALGALLVEFDAEKRAMIRRAHDELVDLACHVAERILGAELERRPDLVRDAVARAVDLASSKAGLTVRLHSRDLETVRAFLPELHRRFADLEPVTLVADDSVGPGGCVVAGREGRVDAAIATQLEEIRRLLLGPASGKENGA